MERLGKQHIGFHLCVTQSIVRELHTTGSSIDKKTHKLEAEVINRFIYKYDDPFDEIEL